MAIGYGLVAGLVFAPPDYQQGDAFRIIYVHVPSAWLSEFVYTTMAVAGAIGAHLAHQGGPCRSGRVRAHRRLFHLAGAGHRIAVGPSRCGAPTGPGTRA
jgi:hypothetical protein